MVFKKIKFSNKEINLVGALNYIKKIINEKIKEVKNPKFEIPPWLLNNCASKVNFTQREYENDYLRYIEKCHQDFWESNVFVN